MRGSESSEGGWTWTTAETRGWMHLVKNIGWLVAGPKTRSTANWWVAAASLAVLGPSLARSRVWGSGDGAGPEWVAY